MRVPLSWLRELIAIELSPEALAERLTLAGLAVDAIETVGRHDGIVTGTIVGLEPHPEADRLRVCAVDAGEAGRFRVVSGAPGLQAGWRVVLARPGARIADGSVVEPVEIRGVASEAVLLSERELGVSDDHSTVMRLAGEVPVGVSIADVLGTVDTVLEIDVTPNRGDCLSILGIAREISALTGERLRRGSRRLAERPPSAGESVRVEILESELCPRYVARVVRGVSVGPSPSWMRARLEAVGLRSINAVVDVTNYVMIERGQPLHAFDLARVGGGTIVVRRAGETRRLATLDGVERGLDADDLVIADASEPVALAGIIGGAGSAVSEATRDVLLEAAAFRPSQVRRTARRLGLRTDASYRFERGVDVEGVISASERAAELLAEVARGTIASGVVDAYPSPPAPIEVTVRSERVNRLLGTSFEVSEIGQWLRRVSASVRAAGRGGFLCRAPTYRADLEREADFVEEVARLAGYDRVPETMPRVRLQANPALASGWVAKAARERLAGLGLFEMVNLRFTAPEWNRRVDGLVPEGAVPVPLANPLSSETAEMATSLLPNLLLAARRNRHQGERSVRAFEIGRSFWRTAAGEVAEGRRVAGVLLGPRPSRGIRHDDRAEDFADLKGVLEDLFATLGIADVRWARGTAPRHLHPGKAACLRFGHDELFGRAGAVHPRVAQAADLEGEVWAFELDFEKLDLYASRRFQFRSLAKFPSVTRSLAVVTDEGFESSAIVESVTARPDLFVEEIRLFDVYRGAPIPEGKKSLAYSIAYRCPDRTLTDPEVNDLHQQLTAELVRRFGVEPRT